MNSIIIQPKAMKQIRKIRERRDIMEKIGTLAHMPDCQNVKKLVNHDYQYRLRVGNYRVFFNFDGVIHVVHIEEVKKRDERTY